MKKKSYDVIMLALPRWDGQYSSTAYSLAQALSAHTRIFYIDNPFTYKDFLTNPGSPQIKKRREALLWGKNFFFNPISDNKDLIVVTPRLTFPINWMSSGRMYDFFARRNDRIVFEVIKKLTKTFSVDEFVFINSFNPLYGRFFPGQFSPRLHIYHCVDDISKSEYISKHGTRLEKEAVQKADLTLVTSMELKRLKEVDSNHVYYHPNAANVELFQKAYREVLPKPEELKGIPSHKKIILYMGNICHRLDYPLLKKIASQFPDAILLMVGPKANDNYREAGLDKLPNVIFTGSKPLNELPVYAAASHCCIIPFLCIPLTRSIYPLKINEYLSAGKPVVTTDFSEDIRNFGDVALLSSSHDGFINNIKEAMAEDSGEKARARVEFAQGNNWESRANQLMEIIDSNLKGNDGRGK